MMQPSPTKAKATSGQLVAWAGDGTIFLSKVHLGFSTETVAINYITFVYSLTTISQKTPTNLTEV
jgi:hypothetical protein